MVAWALGSFSLFLFFFFKFSAFFHSPCMGHWTDGCIECVCSHSFDQWKWVIWTSALQKTLCLDRCFGAHAHHFSSHLTRTIFKRESEICVCVYLLNLLATQKKQLHIFHFLSLPALVTRESFCDHIDVSGRSFATFNGGVTRHRHIGASIIRFDNLYPFMFVNPSPDRISEINLPERQPGDAQLLHIRCKLQRSTCAQCACFCFEEAGSHYIISGSISDR